MIPSLCQLKSHVTSNSLPEKPINASLKLKNDVPRTFFDTNYVEMGVEAIEMD